MAIQEESCISMDVKIRQPILLLEVMEIGVAINKNDIKISKKY